MQVFWNSAALPHPFGHVLGFSVLVKKKIFPSISVSLKIGAQRSNRHGRHFRKRGTAGLCEAETKPVLRETALFSSACSLPFLSSAGSAV